MIESVEVIIRQPGHPDRSLSLEQGAARIGRSDDNELVLPDVGVSRRHAQIFVSREEVLLEDLGSGNGTYFNGQRVQSQALSDGDELVIDPFILQIRIQGAVAAAPRQDDPSPAALEVIVGTGMTGTTYPLSQTRGVTLGRSEERDVVVPDPAASRHHATVVFSEPDWLLQDQGSANGIFLNETRVREQVLVDGDVIRIGNTELRFRLTTAAGEEAASQAPGDVWDPQAGRSQASSPAPASRPDQPQRSNMLLVVAVGAVVMLLAIIALILLVLFGGVLWVTNNPSPTTLSVQPTWDITVQAPLPESAEARFDLGVSRLSANAPGEALEAFHGTLVAQPGHLAAERFARAAGEQVLMRALTTSFSEFEHAQASKRATRDALLATLARGDERSEEAREALMARFEDDPVVVSALDLPPHAQRATEASIRQARAAQTSADAFDAWTGTLSELHPLDGPQRIEAIEKRGEAGRALSRSTSENWRAAMVSEDDGDAVASLSAFDAVESDWPATPARLLHPR